MKFGMNFPTYFINNVMYDLDQRLPVWQRAGWHWMWSNKNTPRSREFPFTSIGTWAAIPG